MSLQGTLKTLGITEVLEFLSTRSASGLLDVTTEMGTASYGLVDGVVVESEYSFIRESGTDAAEATYYVVSELDGTFFFDEDKAPEPSDDGEDVPVLLSRTAEIAERWIEVEETIPSPNHLLTRNNELDGSVTIQPEWWKALEMIGEGRTSLQLASALGLSALDASLTALAMTNAGLLIVREVDPLEIEVDSGFAPIDENSTEHDDLDTPAREDMDAGFSFEHGSEAFETSEPIDEVDPVQMLEVVQVDEPAPLEESSWESAATAMSFATPDPSIPETVETPMSSATPVMSFSQSVDEAETPTHDEFAGRSGMDDLSELEYMVEPEGFVSSGAAYGTPEPAAPEHTPPPVQELDDDGWSSGHVSAYNDLQPLTSAQAAEPAPRPIAEPTMPVQPPAADMSEAHSPFDVIGVPGEATSHFDTPLAPAPELGAEMSLESPPSPPAYQPTFDSALAPVPEAEVPTPDPAAEDFNAATTAMAGEVIDDLASLSDDLEESIDGDTKWELDGTFVPDSNPAPPAVEGDPFGDLGELLNDTANDERSSVLKFLRRD